MDETLPFCLGKPVLSLTFIRLYFNSFANELRFEDIFIDTGGYNFKLYFIGCLSYQDLIRKPVSFGRFCFYEHL